MQEQYTILFQFKNNLHFYSISITIYIGYRTRPQYMRRSRKFRQGAGISSDKVLFLF